MKETTRRGFIKTSLAAGLALGFPRIVIGDQSPPSETVRIGVIGMGDTKAIGGVGGRGHQLLNRLRELSGVKVVALCDVDPSFLDREAKAFNDRGQDVAKYRDLRRLLEDKNIDAVVIALPNHWHALAAIWACQAGKDVYVEKPFAYNLWEGRQMVAAARKYGRMMQVGTQNRSSSLLRRTFDYLHSGELGAVRFAHALVYRARTGIGRVSAPTPVSASVDYDLWCGPSPYGPLMRRQLNYEWHWFWATGNGEMGNNGIHVIDICRWALRQDEAPPRGMSIGGRFAFDDCGQTANTQIALLDYQPAPIICEVRNVREGRDPAAIGKFRGLEQGIVIDCEGGYFAGDAKGGGIFSKDGRKIKIVQDDGSGDRLEATHLENFVAAVRSRKSWDLNAEAQIGHRSAACCHVANTSYRLGKQARPEAIREAIKSNGELADAFERCRGYLRENGVDIGATPAVLGPWLTLEEDRFVKTRARAANALARREYRAPFTVPKIA